MLVAGASLGSLQLVSFIADGIAKTVADGAGTLRLLYKIVFCAT